MFLIWLVIAFFATMVDTVLLRIVLAAVKNAGYVDHVCTWDQALWISAALTLSVCVGSIFSAILDAF